MSRITSLNHRQTLDGEPTGDVIVTLIEVTHPITGDKLRVSTDNTERWISDGSDGIAVDQVCYGTKSNWLSQSAEPFYFIMAGMLWPDNSEDGPPAAQLLIADLDRGIADQFRSITRPSTVSFAMVMASSPDVIEEQYIGLQLVSVDADGDVLALQVSADPIISEPWPMYRYTRSQFGALFK